LNIEAERISMIQANRGIAGILLKGIKQEVWAGSRAEPRSPPVARDDSKKSYYKTAPKIKK